MNIGDNIKCIKTHSQGLVVKGNTYPLLEIKKECSCGECFNVGIRSLDAIGRPVITGEHCKCDTCGDHYISDGFHWFDPSLFAETYSLPRTEAIEELLCLPIEGDRMEIVTPEIQSK